MNRTVITSTIVALLVSSALPAAAESSGIGLNLDGKAFVKSDLVTAQADVGVDAGVDASSSGVDAQVGADANATTGESLDANAAAGASASVDAEDNSFASLSAALAGSSTFDFSAVTDETDITIILVSELDGDIAVDGAGLDEDISANADAQTALHANIDGNAAIKAKLEAEGYTSSDVVAVKSKADGSVLVYVDDRA
jgi:hypothetical protein